MDRHLNEHILRSRISKVLYKRYKIICAEKDLSIPLQTAELIRKFVETQEENKKLMNHIKG